MIRVETESDAAKTVTFPVRRQKVFFGIPFGRVTEAATQEPVEPPRLHVPIIRRKRFLGMTYREHSG